MENLVSNIRASIIGENSRLHTAFGSKPLIYADYTASGRSLKCIEEYIQTYVLPYYANTHTETTYCSAQITALREEARQQIRQTVNASNKDHVIFCGSGATAAINKLIDILNLRLPAELCDRYWLNEYIPTTDRPVVFIGPYEHHSNELPWRESIAEVVVIPLTKDGFIDLLTLEEKLHYYKDRPLKIGSFSAASNVTGLKTDVETITQLLHHYNALSLWDYAAAAPYQRIDMTGSRTQSTNTSKDAVFISPHKFIGGPSTPGVLIVKQHLLNNRVPSTPGGGTVVYVSPKNHRYITHHERREEGGTPGIIESIRAGLVFKLQQAVGIEHIEQYEHDFIQRALARWSKHPSIEILGNLTAPRLATVSLRIKYGDKDLHYGFVVAVLNDVFGIQARGGCSCAGPYGHSLLNMSASYSKAIEDEIMKGRIILRPGWTRMSFNYFIDDNTFEYLVRAVELVADHAWRLLPYYCYDEQSATWRYQNSPVQLKTRLADINFDSHFFNATASINKKTTNLVEDLLYAEKEISQHRRHGHRYRIELPETKEELLWFVLPQHVG